MAFTLSPLSVLAEPVTLAQAKAHLRVTWDSEDELIQQKLTAAREHVEGLARRSLALKVMEYTAEAFPCSGRLDLPGPPVLAVESVSYIDAEGTVTVLEAGAYVYGNSIIRPVFGTRWPATAAVHDAVRVVYTAGYVPALATYSTVAAMEAAAAPEEGAYAEVTADPDVSLNGSYRWDGSAWGATGYARLQAVPENGRDAILLEVEKRYLREPRKAAAGRDIVHSLALSLRP